MHGRCRRHRTLAAGRASVSLTGTSGTGTARTTGAARRPIATTLVTAPFSAAAARTAAIAPTTA
ncbi:MAG: hypothetical protein WAL61_17630, partial [Acidimicrobiales bacterium]